MIKIVKEETFRSKPLVNMDDDMVRVTIHIKRNMWRELKRVIKNMWSEDGIRKPKEEITG